MKKEYTLGFTDYADDMSGVEMVADSLKQLHDDVKYELEERSKEILELYNENLKLKKRLRKALVP